MGSATSNISPERDLLDLHGRVAIVTGAKYVTTRDWPRPFFGADQVYLSWDKAQGSVCILLFTW
jgi:hypothetical protein